MARLMNGRRIYLPLRWQLPPSRADICCAPRSARQLSSWTSFISMGSGNTAVNELGEETFEEDVPAIDDFPIVP